MDYENEKLPIAFSVALAHNSDALKYFSSLPKEGRDRIIEQTWPMNSKAEMYDFVEFLAAEGRNQITQ